VPDGNDEPGGREPGKPQSLSGALRYFDTQRLCWLWGGITMSD